MTYRRLLKYLAPYRVRFCTALCAMVLFGATDGAVPFLIRSVLDDIFGKQQREMLWLFVAALILFAIVRGLAGFLQHYLAATVGLRIVRDLRNEINAHLLTLSGSFFSRRSSGALISTMTNDTLLVRSALTDAVASMLRDSIRVVALLGAAVYLDPFLALIAFVGLPVGMLPIVQFGKRIRRLSRTGQDQFGGLTAILQEVIQGSRIVQAFGMESYEQQRFERENERFTSTVSGAERYGALSGPVNEVIASVAIAVVVIYGGLSVIGGVRTQGDFIAFLTAMFLLYEPLKKLGRVNTIFQGGVAAADRIFEVLDTPAEVTDAPNAEALQVVNPSIEYLNVSFRYREVGEVGPADSDCLLSDGGWGLDQLCFTVPAGHTVALVGPSGGGKSTIVNLLPRFFDPDQGDILIDGHSIKQVTLKSLRRQIAVVSQHTFLFADTVLNNIRYGRMDASDDEVIAAARAAHAHEFIAALPQGYHTQIGEQGSNLSGGERSRIAIARALLKNSPILILDEATAALDSESEALVQAAIDRLMEGRTVLVIAHRLATVRRANRIMVVVGGRIVESGTHEQLLELGREYSKLYRIQFDQVSADISPPPTIVQPVEVVRARDVDSSIKAPRILAREIIHPQQSLSSGSDRCSPDTPGKPE